MSLETAIQENTAAIRELINAIAKGVPVAASTVAAVVSETKNANKPKTETTDKSAAGKKQTGSQSAGATKESQASTAPSDTGASGSDDADGEALKVGGKAIIIRAEELAGILDAKAAEGQAHKEYHFAKFAVLALSKHKGRPMVEALLSRFGVQKGPDLKPEQFADFIRDVDRILVGEYDPEKADTAEEELA